MTKRAPGWTLLAGCVGLMLCIVSTLPAAAGEAKDRVAILTAEGTMWRSFETWQTDVVRLESGELVRVDPLNPRTRVERDDGPNKTVTYELARTKRILGSPFPPEGWQKPDFDDGRWVRRSGSMRTQYRSLALMCIRGKFQVTDPARAADLSLSVGFRGGAVVYLNGQEVGRAYLPKGPITGETLAEDYPKECFVGADGKLISQIQFSGAVLTEEQQAKSVKDEETASRYRQRCRKLEVTIPAKLLRKGVNVLAIEVHRAPAIPVMFTTVSPKRGPYDEELEPMIRAGRWWNRASIDGVTLTAPAGTGAVVPNCSRPKGVQVWNQPVMLNVNWTHYADPNEGLRPIRLLGVRNGVFSGQVIVSSDDDIKALRVGVGDLKGAGGSVIPASAVQVRYCTKTSAGWVPDAISFWVQFDPLEPTPPAPASAMSVRTGKWACQPVWVTVSVPRDAKPGEYAGKITVQAEGLMMSVEVPLQLHVSDWTLPEPRDFTIFSDMVQSPESVALQYNVPMWSQEHWKLIDKSFEMLARIGTKSIHFPVVRRTHLGNEQGMVRWIRKADGSSKYDLSIVERYLDTATRHLGKVPVVCLHVLETGKYHAEGLAFTEVGEKTGALKEAMGPKWGTPESAAFLKPMFDELRAGLARRGMEKSMMVGMHAAGGNGPESEAKGAYSDVKAASGDVAWVRVSHYYFGDLERRPGRPNWGCLSIVGGVIGVFWDVDEEKPVYGWRNPKILLTYPRTTNGDYAGTRLGQDSMLPEHRLCAEAVLIAGRRKPCSATRGNISSAIGYEFYEGLRGFGPFGADFWPVLKGARQSKTVLGRYGDGYAEGGWGTLSLNQVIQSVLAPGKEGPIETARFAMMRESCQEAEARVFVQNAILDEATKARLGPELARKCKELCDERTRALRYVSEFWTFGGVQNQQPMPEMIFPDAWEERSQRLYDLAAEVGKALNRN